MDRRTKEGYLGKSLLKIHENRKQEIIKNIQTNYFFSAIIKSNFTI